MRTAYLCEDCYLFVTMSSTASGKYNYDIREGDILGTKELNPNKLVKQKLNNIKSVSQLRNLQKVMSHC